MSTKVCAKCHIEKTLDLFVKHKSRKNGVFAYCRACFRGVQRKQNVKTRRTEAYKEQSRIGNIKWRAKNKHKTRAHQLAQRHTELPELCEDCKSAKAVHRHHPDYDKPLEVIGLCVPCHEKAHHGVAV